MQQTLSFVKNFIAQNPNGIYVWVRSMKDANNDNIISMQVTPAHALKWCESAAMQRGDDSVPCFVSRQEIFLGA